MKRIFYLFILLTLISACSNSDTSADKAISDFDRKKEDSLQFSIPKKKRPLLSELEGFYKLSDKVRIENKVMKYSLFSSFILLSKGQTKLP
jgi:hypothetical protein